MPRPALFFRRFSPLYTPAFAKCPIKNTRSSRRHRLPQNGHQNAKKRRFRRVSPRRISASSSICLNFYAAPAAVSAVSGVSP